MGKKVGRQELAELFDVTPTTIFNWQRDGMPVESKANGPAGNSYDSRRCIEWWAQRNKRTSRHEPKDGTSSSREQAVFDYQAERARLAFHQANLAQLETEKKKGELWPLETVALMLQRIIGAARGRLLAINGKLRNRVPDMEPRAYELCEDLIREALEELSRDALPASLRGSLERYHSNLEATTEADSQPVGDEARHHH